MSMLQLRIAAISLLLAILAALCFAVKYYHSQAADYKSQRDEEITKVKLANDTIADMQSRQTDAAALDAKYTQELSDAKSENDNLRRKLDDGSRVRVKGKCSVPAATESTKSGSVGNDGSVELSDSAGRNVLDIRAGIISDQAKVKYLQDYINQQCLRKPKQEE